MISPIDELRAFSEFVQDKLRNADPLTPEEVLDEWQNREGNKSEAVNKLPEWCQVFSGMNPAEVEAIVAGITRSSSSRNIE